MINVEVKARDNENNASVLRRFTQRVRAANIVKVARGQRYHSRSKSKLVKKQETLSLIKKFEEMEYLRKIGRLADRRSHR